jgi:ABC-type transport system involved in multi-copper enzyme maturation permease subunit
MNLTLCFLRRDLLARPRLRGFYLKRMGFVLLGGLVVLWGTAAGGLSGSTTVGLQIFQSLASMVLFAVCVLSALTAGLSLMREKIERSLGLLLLTDMSCRQQVAGRLLANAFAMLILTLSVLPLFALAGTLGGISPLQIGAAFLILAGTIFLGCCLGLLCAALAGSERQFTGLAVLLGLAVFAGLPLLVSLGGLALKRPTGWILNIVSPFAAMAALGRGILGTSAVESCLFSAALGLPLLDLAYRLLPRSVLRESSPRIAGRGWRRLLRKRRRARQPPILGNPVAWKDQNFFYGGILREWRIAGFLTLPAVGGTSCLIALALGAEAETAATVTLTVVALTAGFVFAVGTVVRSARAFNTEKLNRTLELLLTSDLEEKEIVGGKIRAVALSTLPWLVFAVAGGLAAVTLTGEFGGILAVSAAAAGALSTVFSLACFALFLSLRMKTPGVLGLCFLVFVLWNWCGKSFLLMLFMLAGRFIVQPAGAAGGVAVMVTMFLGNSAVDVGLGLVFLHALRSNFRRNALKTI